MSRPVVLRRSWWRIWRRSFFGLNPYAWLLMEEIPTRELRVGTLTKVWDDVPDKSCVSYYRLAEGKHP